MVNAQPIHPAVKLDGYQGNASIEWLCTVIGMLSDDSCKTQTWVTNTSLIREATLVHPAITVGLSLQSEL